MALSAAALHAASKIEDADALFRAGKFPEAAKAYAEVLAADPKSTPAQLRMGQLALYANQFDEAEKHLRKALELDPGAKKAKSALAELFHRRDDFELAARWYRETGDDAKAAEMASYKGVTPYRIEGPLPVTLKFVATDPLPVVRVKVNGGEAVDFLIDTGGPEVVLESEFAKRMGVQSVATTTGTFAGGQHAEVSHYRAALTLENLVIKDVPVIMVPLPEVGGRKIYGILGTELLYHFLPTLDYPGGQLILRQRSAETLNQVERQAASQHAIVVPFWMAGDHFMVAWGRVNQAPPALLFIDTGFSKGGFLCPESTLKEAGITSVPDTPAAAGNGSGTGAGQDGHGNNPASPPAQPAGNEKKNASASGAEPPSQTSSEVPFVVDQLSLGKARGEKINGLTNIFPPSLEYAFGFRIAGLISHQFFRPFAVTFDFNGMRLFLVKP